MFPESPLAAVAALVIALVPACTRWWSGRALARAGDDPLLPERLLRHHRRNGIVLAGALILIGFGWPVYLYWTLPLALVARIIASYPLRRTLYDETWSLATYLYFVARLLVAFFGFWMLLGTMPAIASAAGARSWFVGPAIAAVLCLWNARGSEFLRMLLRPRPIADPVLVERFTALVTASGIAMPRFEFVDLRGGAIANAIALASPRQSSVVFTDTVLARLEPDEAVAICAHEIAHLEHYDRSRMRRIGLTNYALIVLGLATVAFERMLATSLATSAVWASVLVFVLVLRARHRQSHETESDLRAVALTGNGEALATALVKIYTFARIPRRWSTQHEHRATHPSLARRVRAIRKAAGTAATSLEGPTTFLAADGSRTVAFRDDRLVLTEGDIATHSLSYSGITELRLDTPPSGGIRLIVVERPGRVWEMPVGESDAAAIQAALDTVDSRLAEPAAAPAVWSRAARILLGIAALLALPLGQFGMLVVALLTLIQPASPLFAAAGASALMTAALLLRGDVSGAGDPTLTVALLLAGLGFAFLAIARSTGADPLPRRAPALVAVIAGCAALALVVTVVRGVDPVLLHLNARSTPSVAVLASAFGTALFYWNRRVARVGAAVATIVALVAAAAGSIKFLDRFGRDPLLLRTAPMLLKPLTAKPTMTFAVGFAASEVIVSPGGKSVALVSSANEYSRDDETPTFHIGAAGRKLTVVKGYALRFLDDEHVVLLQTQDRMTRLRELDIHGAELWTLDVPDVSAVSLSVQPDRREWSVLGRTEDKELVRVDGVVGTSHWRTTHWPRRESRGAWTLASATAADRALILEHTYDVGALRSMRFWPWVRLLNQQRIEVTLSRIDRHGQVALRTSRLDPQCFERALNDDRIVCSVFDGAQTRFVALDPAADGATPVGSLKGKLAAASGAAVHGWLFAWLGSTPVALRLATGDALQIDNAGSILDVAGGDDVLAMLVFESPSISTIRMYSPISALSRTRTRGGQ